MSKIHIGLREREFVFAQALKFTGNHNDAEDLTQDVLLRVVSYRGGFDGKNLRGYPRTITQNVFINEFRHARRQQRAPAHNIQVGVHPEQHRGSEQQMDLMMDMPELIKRLDAVPIEFRLSVVFMDILGFTQAETAAALQIPIGTAGSTAFRGRKCLSQKK